MTQKLTDKENALHARIYRAMEVKLKEKYGKDFDYPRYVAMRMLEDKEIEKKILDKMLADKKEHKVEGELTQKVINLIMNPKDIPDGSLIKEGNNGQAESDTSPISDEVHQ